MVARASPGRTRRIRWILGLLVILASAGVLKIGLDRTQGVMPSPVSSYPNSVRETRAVGADVPMSRADAEALTARGIQLPGPPDPERVRTAQSAADAAAASAARLAVGGAP
jgi:hypothetical protein